MTINVYTVVWNEEFMLPKFIKHYSQWANRIFVIDNFSDDLTQEIARNHPMVTYSQTDFRQYTERDVSYTFGEYASHFKSDWAVCVDADEFIHGLETLKDEDPGVLKTKGYMMIGKTGKLEDCKKIRMKTFDKPVVFDPSLELEFGDGRHSCNLPTRDSKLELWHYKYLSREYYLERNTKAYPRIMNEKDTKYRLKKGLDWYDKHI